MMSFRKAAGFALLSLSVVSVVQTVREVWQSFGSDWTESQMLDNAFTFAGRTITIVKPAYSSVASKSTLVKQERVLIDGVAGRRFGASTI